SLFGWWESLAVCDLDGDGKQDLILGNIGENGYLHPDSADPVKLWTNIFAMDGTPQSVLSRTIDGKDMPVFLKHNLEDQFPYLKKQNLRHEVFATKTVQELFGDDMMRTASVKTFNYCSSIIARNAGGGNFVIEKLPPIVQFSSVNAINCTDVNDDGKPDIIMGGNQYGFPPQFGRLDANYGIVMINNGNGKFKVMDASSSGIQLTGQVRDIKEIKSGNTKGVLFLRNEDYPVLYKLKK
ncbi:MAG: FG-GAP repeat protein, partial [Bacteroidetes bacterium]|nr:FG-GAP repeat protein [Bacteroidota bacterium]